MRSIGRMAERSVSRRPRRAALALLLTLTGCGRDANDESRDPRPVRAVIVEKSKLGEIVEWLKVGATMEGIMEVLKLCVAQGVQAGNLGVPILTEELVKKPKRCADCEAD